MDEKIELIREFFPTDIPDEKLAEIAGLTAEQVHEARAAAAAPTDSDKKVADAIGVAPELVQEARETVEPKGKRTAKRAEQLADAAQRLIDELGYQLVKGRLVPPAAPATGRRADPLVQVIRLLEPLPWKRQLPNGKWTNHTFHPSVYRGEMAELVIRAAGENTQLWQAVV